MKSHTHRKLVKKYVQFIYSVKTYIQNIKLACYLATIVLVDRVKKKFDYERIE